jgi:hypothetical protein
MKGGGRGYGLPTLLLVLFLVVAFLPGIRSTFARSFPEGFRNVDCKGVICREGEFCQENVCRPVAAAITNNYFPRTTA